MNINEVTKAQAKTLMAGLFPGGHYLATLKERMVKAGFPHDDPLFVLVSKAYDAERELYGKVCWLAATRGAKIKKRLSLTTARAHFRAFLSVFTYASESEFR